LNSLTQRQESGSATEHRLVVLDTETTGIDPKQGHRIVEIGCVELINRQFTGRKFHAYINPLLQMEQEVINIHGLTNDFLSDKPVFSAIVAEFIDFIRGAELVIHNARFDIGFIDHEFALLRQGLAPTEQICTVTDTLKVAKDEFGSPKTLDYLAKYFSVDKLVDRTYHGALIDAQLLAFVYIEMTRKQETFNLSHNAEDADNLHGLVRVSTQRVPLPVIYADQQELAAHQQRLALIQQKGVDPLWSK
jgi:DNA polymerase III subunit epsilon